MGKHHNGKQNPIENPMPPATNPTTMGRNGLQIMKEIAFGRYNIAANGQIFRNKEFSKAVLLEAEKKLKKYKTIYTALEFTYSMSLETDVKRLIHEMERKVDMYTLICGQMYTICATGDTHPLYILADRLGSYKNSFYD